jgi:hypothetical protein
MLFKNVASQKIHIYAYDSTTGAPKTGDAANITGYISLDGTANAIDDTNPTEVDATNMKGVYVFDLTQAETNCNAFALCAESSTANIRIEPIIGFTTPLVIDANGKVAVPDTQKVDMNTVKGQTINCAAEITINPSVGAATIQPTNAQLEARTLAAGSYFDPAADTVAHVTLVDTTTTNTDMVDEAPSVADIADAVWDEALAGHAVAGSAGEALSAAGTADDPWLTALPGAYVAGTAGYLIGNMTQLGAGAIEWPYTLTNSSTGLPIDGAEVWVSSDSAGNNIIASGTTDTSGEVTFYLDAGTVYVWAKKSGYNIDDQPDMEVVA